MFLIAEAMMLAMSRNPHDGWAFPGQCSEQGKHPSQRAVCLKAGVCQQSVKAQADTQTAGYPAEECAEQQTVPRKVKWRGQRPQMQERNPDYGGPFQPVFPLALAGDVIWHVNKLCSDDSIHWVQPFWGVLFVW